MVILSLQLSNFRNYSSLHLDFDDKINIFYGDNAQGKTNILESLYLSATTKSHKNSRDKEMIRFDENEAHIRTVVDKKGIIYEIDLHLRKNRSKGIAINRFPIRRAAELFGILNIVFFSPEDLNIIKEGPSLRRRFMDMELCQLDKIYYSDLESYHHVLDQRNRLLREAQLHPNWKDTLSVWDEQLISYGKKIIRRREEFLYKLAPLVSQIHSEITGGSEDLRMIYEPSVREEAFEHELAARRERDLHLRASSIGPHRDDILFLINGADIRTFGSQGQQRTAALSLKLAEIELVKELIHDTPVLLLDDVLSELDSSRQTYLLKRIRDIQVMITGTGLDDFIKNRFAVDKVFFVRQGKVFEQGETGRQEAKAKRME